jgi:hypothetical protein
MPETIVTIAEEDGKWHMTGPTYIENDENKPWPVDMEFGTEAEAISWAEKHGWTVQ